MRGVFERLDLLIAEPERGGISGYNALLLGIGDIRSLCLLDGLARALPPGNGAAEGPAPEEYDDEKGGGIGMGSPSSGVGDPSRGTTGGSGLVGGPMGVKPGGRLLSGKVLYMYDGITGEFGTVGTSGGPES
jgi:hypothetical protein